MFRKIKSRSFILCSQSLKNNYFCSFTLHSKILNEHGASAASRHTATTLVFYERTKKISWMVFTRGISNASLHYLEMQMNQLFPLNKRYRILRCPS